MGIYDGRGGGVSQRIAWHGIQASHCVLQKLRAGTPSLFFVLFNFWLVYGSGGLGLGEEKNKQKYYTFWGKGGKQVYINA